MKLNSRTQARRLAMQGIYEWQMSGNNIGEIETRLLVDKKNRNIDFKLFRELLHNIPKEIDELDGFIAEYIDRPMDEIDPVESAILRLGTYELSKRPDVPYRVVINEAVELTKTYGAETGHKYVNGIMDKLAAKLRAVEVAARKK
ncbi:Transcription termination protein NusB [hydrothermal vent metagenome]|uniref:Transcription termination protein NusB n=1 Tax=hydrothermal vent metagenome TaxID=652676 RepID=A0A3B1ARX8_9ZZZZ